MFRKIANISKSIIGGTRAIPSTVRAFGPITSLKFVIAQVGLGFLRRPILTDAVSQQIVSICIDAQGKSKLHTDLGIGFKVRVSSERGTKWLPSSIAILRQTRQQVLQKASGKLWAKMNWASLVLSHTSGRLQAQKK